MPEMDLDTINKIFESLAIVRTLTDRNTQDIRQLDDRDKSTAERHATAIQAMEVKKLEAHRDIEKKIEEAKQELDRKIQEYTTSSCKECEERCGKYRSECEAVKLVPFVRQVKQDKWFRTKISKFWWAIGSLTAGAILGGLFRELWALIFK